MVFGFLALTFLIVGIVEFTDHRVMGGIGGCVAGAAFISMFVATKKMSVFSRASYERAKGLAEQIGLGEEALVLIDLNYGEITEAEAERRLNDVRASQEE